MSQFRGRLSLHRVRLAVARCAAVLLVSQPAALAWGPEGHKTIAIMASRELRPETRAQMRELLASESMAEASLWADEVAHTTRTETASWHYIDIPLRASSIDLDRDCPGGNCVLVKTGQFLAILSSPRASIESRRDALKFVIHFVSDLHQPLHCEDNHDKGGNMQEVIFEHHPDNLHWVWDAGLVQLVDPDAGRLATTLGRELTALDRSVWTQGRISDWILESHRLAQRVAYSRGWTASTPVLDRAYDERAEATIRIQLEKASVRLAYLLNQRLGGLPSHFHSLNP